jgi:DNA-directed RNA polymerase specialized sigma24 family protein
VAALVEAYQAGATVYELAERFKIHRQTVSKHLHREGVKMRRRGLDDQQVVDATALYERGWSLARIGRKLEVQTGTVWMALRSRGVTMRDTHGKER